MNNCEPTIDAVVVLLSGTATQACSSLNLSGSTPTVGGRFVAGPPIASPGDIEAALCHLQELIGSKGKLSEDARDELLSSWMVIEQSLLADEVDELRPEVFGRLFPGTGETAGRSRNGLPSGGGR